MWRRNLYGTVNRTFVAAGYSAEAQQFFDRITDPGTPRKNAYAAIIDALVAISSGGIWTNTLGLWIIAVDTSLQANALINLKSSSFALIKQGSPSFVSDGGYSGTDGATSNYFDTQLSPSTSLTQNAVTIAASTSGTNAASGAAGGVVIGSCTNATNNTLMIIPRYFGNSFYGRVNEGSGGNVSNSESRGFFSATRRGASLSETYIAGASVANPNTTSTTAASANLYLLASNSSTGAFFGSAQQLSAAIVINAATSDAENTSIYDAFNNNKWW